MLEKMTIPGQVRIEGDQVIVEFGEFTGIQMSRTVAYRTVVELLAALHGDNQIESYRIVTKAGSDLNYAVTKDW